MTENSDCCVLLPGFDSTKKKASSSKERTQKIRCGCSATSHRDEMSKSSRMVLIVVTMLFGLCVLLFIWNIVLWRQLDGLQNEVSALKHTVNEMTSEEHSSSPSRNHRSIMRRRRALHEYREWKRKFRDSNEEKIEVIQRKKRSAAIAPEPAEAEPRPDAPEQSPLNRNNRKSTGRRRRNRGERREKRRNRGDNGRKVLQQATAMHLQIAGSRPYQGMQADANGLLHSWRETINQGFDLTHTNDSSSYVEIKETGVYFIYSQVTFIMSRGVEVHEKILAGFAGVSELASCGITLPRNHGDSDYITCNSYGIARLNEGDRIKLKIHPPHLEVFDNPSYTYYGAFLLGG